MCGVELTTRSRSTYSKTKAQCPKLQARHPNHETRELYIHISKLIKHVMQTQNPKTSVEFADEACFIILFWGAPAATPTNLLI